MRVIRVAFTGLALGLAFALGVVCATAAAAAQGGRDDLRLDMLTHFAPFWAGGGLVVLAAGAFMHHSLLRAMLLALGLVATVSAGSLILPELTRPTSPAVPPGAPGQIKMIQYNCWARNLDVARTADWLVAQNADIIVMEEATPKLRDAVLARHPFHVTCKRCSVMIFSRAKPSATGVKPPDRTPGPRAPMTRATFTTPQGDFTVIGVHYTWPTPDGMQQAQGRRFARFVDRFDKKGLIIAGDFNSTPWSFTRRAEDRRFGVERRTRALFSWPAEEFSRHQIKAPVAFLPIDHVYAGPGWRTVSVERGPKLGSDHYPVIVTLSPAKLEPSS